MVKIPHCKLTSTKSQQMMHEIKNQSDMNEAIENLSHDTAQQKTDLTKHIEQKVESLAPSNIMKSVAGQVTANPSLKKNLLLAAVGVTVVWALKKFSGRKNNGKSLLLMALTGAGAFMAKKLLASNKT